MSSNDQKTLKTLYLSKLSDTNTLKKIQIEKEITEQFTSINKYFDISEKMIINKRNAFNKSLLFNKLEPSIRGGTKRATFKKSSNKEQSESQSKPSINQKSLFESIDNNQLKEVYAHYCKNKPKTLLGLNVDIPKEVESRLMLQAKSLQYLTKKEKYQQRLSKYLSDKTKKSENDLLINSINEHGFKKEIIQTNPDLDDSTNVIQTQKRWHVSLRKPNAYPKIMPSGGLSGDIGENRRRMLHEVNSLKGNALYKTIESIKVRGRDLLKVEYDQAIGLKGTKFFNRKLIDYKHNPSPYASTPSNMNKAFRDKNTNEILYTNYKSPIGKSYHMQSSPLQTEPSSKLRTSSIKAVDF